MEVDSHPSPTGRWDDPKREWEALLDLARSHEERGDDAKGLAIREQMLLVAKAGFGEDSEEVLRGCESFVIRCNQRAMRLLQEGELDDAFNLLRKAEMLTDKNGSLSNTPAARLKCRAVTLNNIGLFYRHRGQQHAALSYLEQALEIESGTSDSHSENPAATLLNLCAVHSALGRHHVSLKYAKKALASLKKKGSNAAKLGAPIAPSHTSMLAVAHHAIGCQYEGMMAYHKAAGEYVQAVVLARQASADTSAYKSAYTSVVHKARMSGKISEAVLPQLPPDPRDAKRPSTGNSSTRTGAAFRQGLPTVHSAPARRRASAAITRPSTAGPTPPRPTTAGNPPRTSPEGGALYKQPSLAEQQAAMCGQSGRRKQQPSPYAPRPPSSNPRIRAAKQAYELIYKPAASLAENLSDSHKKALEELDKLSKEHLLNAQRELVPAPPATEPHVPQAPQQPRASPVSQVRLGQFGGRVAQADAYMMEVPESASSPVYSAHSPASLSRPQTANIHVQASRHPTTPVAQSEMTPPQSVRKEEHSPTAPRLAFQHRHRDTPLADVAPRVVAASLAILIAAYTPCPAVSEEGTSAGPSPVAVESTPEALEEETTSKKSDSGYSSCDEASTPEPCREAPMAEVVLEAQPHPEEILSQPQPAMVVSPQREELALQERPPVPVVEVVQLVSVSEEVEEKAEDTTDKADDDGSSAVLSPRSAVKELLNEPAGAFANSATGLSLPPSQAAPAPPQAMTAEQNKELVAKVVALGSKLDDLHEQILRGYAAGGSRIRLEREKARQTREGAATSIQKVWRGSRGKLMWKRRQHQIEEERHLAEVRRAACVNACSTIQRAWRTYVSRHLVQAMRTKRDQLQRAHILMSVTTLQSYARSALSAAAARVKRMRVLLRSVRLAQARWRGLDARTKFRKLKLEWGEKKKIIEFGSATRIQGWWRRMMALRAKEESFKQQWEELVNKEMPSFAAGRIKLWWKWLIFERKLVTEVRRVSMEKERIRQVEEQVEYLKNLQCKSSVVIQQAFRQYLAQRQLRYLQVTDLERKIAYLEAEEKAHASKVVQDFARIVRARRCMERRRKEVAEFEALKAWKKEKEIQREAEVEAMRRVERAAVRLQAVWRGYHYRSQEYNKRLAELMRWEEEQGVYVTRIAKVWRGWRVRKEVGFVPRSRTGEGWATMVQRFGRAKLSEFELGYRKVVGRIEAAKREYMAAACIQKWWVAIMRKRVLTAQNATRRASRDVAESHLHSAVVIQALYRGFTTRKQLRTLRAACTVQRFFLRVHASARVSRRRESVAIYLSHSDKMLRNSLLVIQAFSRQRLSRILCTSIAVERLEDMKRFLQQKRDTVVEELRQTSAQTIQRAWRGKSARNEAGKRRGIRRLQRVGRGRTARGWCRVNAAVVVVQRFGRWRVAVRDLSGRKEKKMISDAVRGIVHGAILKVQGREDTERAVATLQRAFRKALSKRVVARLRAVRRTSREDLISDEAASIIQRFVAATRAVAITDTLRMDAVKKLHAEIDTDAATLIQATFRGRKQHVLYHAVRQDKAARVITSAMRVNLALEVVASRRGDRRESRQSVVETEAANTIKHLFTHTRDKQSVSVKKAARNEHHTVIKQSDAAGVIQRSWRRRRSLNTATASRRRESLGLVQDDAAAVIQAFYRGQVSREYVKKVKAACALQRAWKVFRSKNTVSRVRQDLEQVLSAQEEAEKSLFEQ